MAVKIGITISGLNEALNFLAKFPPQYKTARRTFFNSEGDKGVQMIQEKAHVITGKMKAMLHRW